MRAKIAGSFIAATAVLAFGFSLGTPAAPKTKAPLSVSGAEAATPDPAAAREPHPQIREAIASLRRAKEHMEHAAHDFGGHRVEAIRATDAAIQQLEECLRYDKD
jgi:hypothetical protein